MENILVDDRYFIKATIGHGGYAKVFLAFDKVFNQNVAIKIVQCDIDENSKNYRMFKQEAMTLAALNNPNIVKVYSSGIYDNKAYLVMDYVKGKSLRDIIKENGYLLVDEIVSYLKQIINGIEACHKYNIIHRDIKPQNIIKKSDGYVVLLDFGTAFISEKEKNLYQENDANVIGTVQYMAPELIDNPCGSIQTDIYAIGIMMFEMFTGKHPFPLRDVNKKIDVIIMHKEQAFPSVRKLNPNTPEDFENIIYKCCEKDPQKRYKNVNELYLDILNAYDKYKNPPSKKKNFFQRIFKI